ncbi:hypothetical protein [Reinekea sp. G2M2-21]|uniref:hypothetical protein n=1 Tax=Reinekea sp. G2M2-21 TaxID=2788942 RepID=UPI0018A9E1B6|nr:hypothetical protein [Reinekea sp. G2M2-21]
MVEIRIAKNVFVGGLTWTYLSGDDRYKRLSNVKKDGLEAGARLGLGLHPKFPQTKKDSGFGFVPDANFNRKWVGKRSLAAVIAARVPNGIAFFPVDSTASQVAMVLVLNGIPLVDVVAETDRIDLEIGEVIREHLGTGDADTFYAIRRPRFVFDESLLKAEKDTALGYALEQLKSAVEEKGFEVLDDEIYGDLSLNKLPAKTSLRLLKGFEPVTIISVVSILFVLITSGVLWKINQDRIADEIRRSRLAELANLSGNDGPSRQEQIEIALEQLQGQVGDDLYAYYVVNSADNYPMDWPLRVVDAVSSLPKSIGGFEVFELTCSTIQSQCLVQFRNSGKRSSLVELDRFVSNSELLSALKIDSNRTQASAKIKFQPGQPRTPIEYFGSLSNFTESALRLSDEIFENYVYADQFVYGPQVDASFEQPVSEEVTARPTQEQGDLVEDVGIPSDWIVHQRVRMQGPNKLTLQRAINSVSTEGFGFTDLTVTFNEFQEISDWQTFGRLVRSGTAQTNKVFK